MTEVNTRRHASFTVLMAMGVLTITFFAATVTAESLPPKPHYLGAEPDLSASSISGVRLSAINPGSPAEKAGLQVGDIIVKLGTVAIKNPEDFIVALKSTTPNRPAEVIYLRQGKESRTQVSLEPRR
jgi:S1-C subfamily serine protease